MHSKEKCKHGVVVRQCRCPNGIWSIVPCPDRCEQDEYVPKHMKVEK